VDYANSATKELLDSANEKMTLIVMPSSYLEMGKIIRDIELKGFRLTNARSFCLIQSPEITESLAQAFPGEDDHAVEANNEGIGASISFQGKQSVSIINEMRSDLHNQYGSGIWFCRTSEQVETFENILFSPAVKTTATYDNCTCCIVKPHVIKAKTAGEIVDAILTEGYEISAMQIFHLDQASASEFFEVYDGVVNEFHAIVDEFTSGPALVLEIRAEEAVSSFRKFAGPWDVNFAKELYPSTLRARFGKNRVENAVHCTDLETEGVSEVSYFFDILASR